MMLVGAVTTGARVLDVGCATGYLGRWLREHKQATVWGIEPSVEAAAMARAHGYTEVYVGSIETVLETQQLAGLVFDHILLGDVLEHVVDPVTVLQTVSMHLAPGGTAIISVPNVAHYSVRLRLLLGKWNMTETGIMDRTHLHFYTRATAQQMVTQAGLQVVSIKPRGDIDRWAAKIGLRRLGEFMLRVCPGWWSIQTVIVAKKI